MPRFQVLAAALAAALGAASAPALAQASAGAIEQAAPSSYAAKPFDGRFVRQAALGGMTEVQLSRFAAANSPSPAVKDFAQKMVDDHTKADNELAGIASAQGIKVPAALDGSHQRLVDKFNAMKGADFDQAYWQQMLSDHKKTVALMRKEAKAGQNPDIKAFAARTLPTVQMHLKMVQDAMSGHAPSAMSAMPGSHG